MSLKRDPIGSNITFLENVDAQTIRLRDTMNRKMDFAAIAEHNNIGNGFATHQFRIPLGQVRQFTTITQLAPPSSVGPIATAKVDAKYVVPTGHQCPC